MQGFLFEILGVALLFAQTGICIDKSYDGYKVLTLEELEKKEDVELLRRLQNEVGDLDFWSEPGLKRKTQIMVSPSEFSRVEGYLEDNDFQYNVTIDDVQRLLNIEKESARKGSLGGMNWRNYQRLKTIYAWMDRLALKYPLLVKVFSIGKSFEKRNLKILKISTGGRRQKPGIYIDAGIHAREWIAPATATYIINQILKSSFKERKLLANIDWYFVPVINPDGYEYSHTKDRLWRKTRSTYNGSDCVGVDANRNFDFRWGEAGVNKNPCSNTYPGPFPFSEPEANATAKFLCKNQGQIHAYVSLHSYSQVILTPYGRLGDLPMNYAKLIHVGEESASAIRKSRGTEYKVGSSSMLLYENSGSSLDWSKGVANIELTYTIELPDKGKYGFLLPAYEIKPTGEETWKGIKVIARQLLKQFSR